jgi:type VI secretion system secreted protein Hcp
MAANILLKLDGVEGESKVDGHEKEIDILSASFGASNATSVHFGGGAGTAKCNVHDLAIAKRCDASSADLFLKTCTGEHYDTATLTYLKAGGNDNTQVPYLQYEMTEVYVSGWHQSGGGDQFAQESVSLSFGKVKVSYWPQNDDGSQGDVKEVTFDIAKNKKES